MVLAEVAWVLRVAYKFDRATIKMHAIEILKTDLLANGLSRKRLNNILACLGKMLRYAHEIELIETVPRVKLLKVPQQRFDFAGLRTIGSHVLRHTFCSHLAMRGAAPKAIQELVGHSTLTMTLRYMHLAPSALTEAIGLLNFGQPVGSALSGSC